MRHLGSDLSPQKHGKYTQYKTNLGRLVLQFAQREVRKFWFGKIIEAVCWNIKHNPQSYNKNRLEIFSKKLSHMFTIYNMLSVSGLRLVQNIDQTLPPSSIPTTSCGQRLEYFFLLLPAHDFENSRSSKKK